MKIAIFYHCLFYLGEKWLQPAFDIAASQMGDLEDTGLVSQAEFFAVGINGGEESLEPASLLFHRADQLVLHGLDSRNENSTILMMERWVKNHPDWFVLYFHCKGGTHAERDPITTRWRECMQGNVVRKWRRCVVDLETHEAVGCHWMEPPATPEGQFIFAGTFFWARSNFMMTLPSILDRPQIKNTGLKHLDSRYEAEVWLGNGPRPPRVKDYHGPNWNPGKWPTCAV